jgi:hypothetical protein
MISAKELNSVALVVHNFKLIADNEKLENSGMRDAVVQGIRLFML